MFVGREDELARLNSQYSFGNGFVCYVIHGRHGVGKTSLIHRFIKDKNAVCLSAVQSSLYYNLRQLPVCLSCMSNPPSDIPNEFLSISDAFDFIVKAFQNRRTVFVIDNYPALVAADKTAIDIINTYINGKFKGTNMMLILCGLEPPTELNECTINKIEILPFDYHTSAQFCKMYNSADRAAIYGITGGMPRYLECIDDTKSLKENIKSLFLESPKMLYSEPLNLLRQEFHSVDNYNAIITSIARKIYDPTAIADLAGISLDVCEEHIQRLIKSRIISAERRFNELDSEYVRYCLNDNLFSFWYRFVFFLPSLITQVGAERYYEEGIALLFNEYMHDIFIQMCMQHLERMNVNYEMPFFFTDMFMGWDNDFESDEIIHINIVATNGKQALICGCVFDDIKVGTNVIEQFMSKSKLIKDYDTRYHCIFSKAGFEDNSSQNFPENVQLITLDDMY